VTGSRRFPPPFSSFQAAESIEQQPEASIEASDKQAADRKEAALKQSRLPATNPISAAAGSDGARSGISILMGTRQAVSIKPGDDNDHRARYRRPTAVAPHSRCGQHASLPDFELRLCSKHNRCSR